MPVDKTLKSIHLKINTIFNFCKVDQQARFKVSVDSELSEVIAQLNKVASAHEALTSQVGLGNAKIDNAYRSQSLAINKLTTEIGRQADAERKAQSERDKASAAHEKSLKQIGSQYDYLGNQVATFKAYMLGAFAVDQVLNFGKRVLDAAGNMQQFQISLEVMLQSKSKADKLMAEVIEFTKKTPFTLEQTQEATNRLLAYGVASEEVIRTLNSLGNIAAAVGTEKLPQLILAFGQVKAAGHLTGAELRQFQEAGVNMLEALSAATGKSVATIQKDISKGIISFADVQKALFSLGEEGGRFASLMEKQSTTITGKLSNLSDSVYQFFARLGNSRTGVIAGVTDALTDFFGWLGDSSRNMEMSIALVKAGVSGWVAYKTILETVVKTKALLVLETKAAALATATNTAVTAAGTVATTGLTGAVNTLWVAMRANPLGFVIGLLSSLYSAYQLMTAASINLQEQVSHEQLGLETQRAKLTELVNVATAHEVGTQRRTAAIKTLVAEYPEYFRGIDTEKMGNAQLRGIIDQLNISLSNRIALARESYRLNTLQEERNKLFQQEAELMDRLKEKAPELYNEVGGSVQKLAEKIRGMNIEQFRALSGVSSLGDVWDNLVNGKITNSALQLDKKMKEIDKSMAESSISSNNLREGEKIHAINMENAKHVGILKSLDKGSKEYEAEMKRHTDVLGELTGKVNEKIEKLPAKLAAASKSSLELSLENQVKELKALEQTQATKLDLLNVEEQLMIERARRQIKNKEDETARILSIQQEYESKRAKLLENSIDYKMGDLRKLQEQADKELAIRNTLADDIVDLTLHVNGLILKEEEEKAERIREIGRELMEAQKTLNEANIKLGEIEAVKGAKNWQDKELLVMKYYQKVNELALENARKQEKLAQEEYDKNLRLYGQSDELTQKSLLSLTKAKAATGEALAGVEAGSISIAQKVIEKIIEIAQVAMAVVQMLAENYIETTREAADSLDTVAGYIDKYVDQNRKALQEQLADVTLTNEQREAAIDASLNRETELVKRKSAMLTMRDQLTDIAERTENTMALVQAGLNTVVAFAKGDFVGGIMGVMETINLMFQRSAMEQLQQEMEVLREKQRTAQMKIQLIEAEIEARGQALEMELAALDRELAAFKAVQEEKERILNQASEDQQLRLLEDQNFRTKLLEAGEAREIAALEAARDRELKRAAESGATAQELADITNAFAELVRLKHEEYENAKLDKTEAVSLATQEVKAQEKDKVNALKEEERQKTEQVENEKKRLSEEYRNFVQGAQSQIFEQQKHLAILEIKMEIAKLKAQKRKLFANKKALDAAIAEMNGLINEITGGGGEVADDWGGGGGGSGGEEDGGGGDGGAGGGGGGDGDGKREGKFHGTEYLLRNGQPSGRDTIPISAHEGERIVQSYLNERLMRLRNRPTNAQLVEGYIRYDRIREMYPHMFNLAMPQLSLKLNSLADVPVMPEVNFGYDPALLSEVRRLTSTLENKPGVIVNATKTGLSITERRANSLNRIYTNRYRA